MRKIFGELKLNSDIKYIKIVFENLESIVVPIKQVDSLYVSGIKSYLLYQNHFSEFILSDQIDYKCEYAGIVINFEELSDLEYEREKSEVLGMYVGNDTVNSTKERPEVLGRIMQFNDISHLYFLGNDKESILSLAVPWGNQEYYNDYMKVEVDKGLKRLNITFSKDRK